MVDGRPGNADGGTGGRDAGQLPIGLHQPDDRGAAEVDEVGQVAFAGRRTGQAADPVPGRFSLVESASGHSGHRDRAPPAPAPRPRVGPTPTVGLRAPPVQAGPFGAGRWRPRGRRHRPAPRPGGFRVETRLTAAPSARALPSSSAASACRPAAIATKPGRGWQWRPASVHRGGPSTPGPGPPRPPLHHAARGGKG